jgi:dipeptidyl-peptidase 4
MQIHMTGRTFLLVSTLSIAFSLGTHKTEAQDQARHFTTSDCERAAKVLTYNLADALQNMRITPHWMSNHDVLWYRRHAGQGVEYVVMNANTGQKTPAFDHQRLAVAALKAAPNSAIHADELNVVAIEPEGAAFRVKLRVLPNLTVSYELASYTCVNSLLPSNKPDELVSPDGHRAVFTRNDDLWIRDRNTGQERQLTTDGEPFFSYGKLSDHSFVTIPHLRNHSKIPPVGVAWSPDGKILVGTRTDERSIENYPYVAWSPPDGAGFRPILYNLRLALLGDKGEEERHSFVIDVESGKKRDVELPQGWFLSSTLSWSANSKLYYALAYTIGNKTSALVEIDALSGKARSVIEETSATHIEPNEFIYSAPDVRILGGGKEAIWFSERDGWGHLYLYDVATGTLKNRITSGQWLVRDIIHVDEAPRIIYFIATGRETGRDLYYRHLYRVSFDGSDLKLVTSEDAEHEIEGQPADFIAALYGISSPEAYVSPSGRFVVDTYSTVNTPPVTVLRSTADGSVVAKIEQADASAIYSAGWRPPERYKVKASDGQTDLYGVIYLPPDYRTDRSYPVIDAFYGGPQQIVAPRSFEDAVSSGISRESLAQLGFIVVAIDARGTPGRSRAFHDIGYGNFADPQIEDHIAAIKDLAKRFGTLDLDRVGVYGHSFGGYVSARAILSHPEFYKVAVSAAGSQNYQGLYEGFEPAFGIPDYGHGERFRPRADAIPENYKLLDNAHFASNLGGHLMLVYGDMDENVLPGVTLQLADALIKANKSFDLIYLPNRTHELGRDPYYVRRMWDYFVEHLMRAEPPENFNLNAPKSQ